MLVSDVEPRWWYMEIPRTGSTTIDRGLRRIFPKAKAIYQKHWPILPPSEFNAATSITSIRDPYSRAVSCWQYFTKPGQFSFSEWIRARLDTGFVDNQIEARPQAFWYCLRPSWDAVIRQESFDADFWSAVHQFDSTIQVERLTKFNVINGAWVNRVGARVHRDRPWQDYYDDISIVCMVNELYAEDFYVLENYYGKKLFL